MVGLITTHEQQRRRCIDTNSRDLQTLHDENRDLIRDEDLKDYDDAVAKGMGIVIGNGHAVMTHFILTNVAVFWSKE